MAEKNIKSRVVLKHDVESNWLLATGFTPLKGEVIIYDPDSNYSYSRFKIGNGSQNVNALPFVDDALRTELVAQIGDVDTKVDAVSALVGDTAVSTQISEALDSREVSWNDLTDKPFCVAGTSLTTILPETSVTIEYNSWAGEGVGGVSPEVFIPFVEGQSYVVTLNNEQYNVVATNNRIRFDTNNGYFYIYSGSNSYSLSADPEGVYTLQIDSVSEDIDTIDEKYIPDTIARTNVVNELSEVVNDLTIDKMDAHHPTGSGSFSMNRKSGTSIGQYSHTEGYNTTASGNYSHAEGYETTASGSWDHAEGDTTTASGAASHAEGYGTTASGYASHAEGNGTTASGLNAHAEGSSTTASGENSHAEGRFSIAYGDLSHSEGQGTIAKTLAQHVQGEYNIEDPMSRESKRGTYVHIVGNGTDFDNRSNAHTLDWDGNAWYAGTIKIGGTGQDDTAAVEVATTEYVDTAIAAIPTPDVSGQIEAHNTSTDSHEDIRSDLSAVSTLVGDTSVSEQISSAIEEATADDFGVYVQDTEPTDAVAGDIWIDTSSDPAFIVPNLPEVTSADNGKILMVVNGKWQAVNLNLSVDANGVLSV